MMRKQYTAAFKAKVVQELLKEEKTFAQIAAQYEVHPTQLKNWRTEPQRHDALRLFHKDRRGQKQRIFQKAKAPVLATWYICPKN